jgi:creatinine amidohydrolase
MQTADAPLELDKLTWAEARDAAERGAGILLTVTSTEQHGFHLPLGTDAITGQALALAASVGLDLVVAPVLAYGYRSRPLSGGGQRFPGTVSLRGATLVSVLVDILTEFQRTGFKRIVLMAHHMENQNFIYEAAYETVGPEPTDETRVMVIESPYPRFSPALAAEMFPDGPPVDGPPGVGLDHAGLVETALMMHVRPELVRTDLIGNDTSPHVPGYDMLPVPDGFTSPSGVLSSALPATPEIGARCFAEITTYLHGLIRDGLFPERADGRGRKVEALVAEQE